MAVPTDYFDTRVDVEGVGEPSKALEDVEALEAAVSHLRRLANSLTTRHDAGLEADWTPAQVKKVKDRYPGLRKALQAAVRATPTP